jgi:hypothetical protein
VRCRVVTEGGDSRSADRENGGESADAGQHPCLSGVA